MNWSLIHDFLEGYGYRCEDERVVFHWQAKEWLNIDLADECNFEEIYEKLQPHLIKRAERIAKHLKEHPIKFDNFVIPNINKPWPEIKWTD